MVQGWCDAVRPNELINIEVPWGRYRLFVVDSTLNHKHLKSAVLEKVDLPRQIVALPDIYLQL